MDYNDSEGYLLFNAPEILSHQDYTAFGLEWHRSPGLAGDQRYRYGFNGKEQDTNGEWGGLTHYDYGVRIYNPAIAKFLSVDPLSPDYPELTPYQFASNRPIDGIDLDGLEYLDTDEAHVGIRNGEVHLNIDNFSRVARNSFLTTSGNTYIGPDLGPGGDCPTGCIGREITIAKFTVRNLPSDLSSGVSMDNGVPPNVDPTRNPYRQEVKGERRPLVHSEKNPKNNGKYNYSYKPRGESSCVSASPRGSAAAGRGHIVVSATLFALVATTRYLNWDASEKVNEHFSFAIKALNDVTYAANHGPIPKIYLDETSIDLLANFVLSGETRNMSISLIKVGKSIYENVSTPNMRTIESGLDNYKPIVIEEHLKKDK